MIFKFNAVSLLRRCYGPLASAFVRHRYANLAVSGVNSSPHSTRTTSRAFSVSWTLRTDTDQPKDKHMPQELDLDIWKSVMKSQALEEKEKLKGEEKNSSAEEEELSPLEATRRLVEMWQQAGRVVPEHITDEQLETLAELTTKSSKKKYLKYLAIREHHKEANKKKKEEKKAESRQEVEARRADGESDGEGEEADGVDKLKNTYMLRFWTRSFDKTLGWRMVQAMQYGQPLIYDMSYEQHMTRRELENTISQLVETEGWNRRAADPFHLHYCNLQPDSAYQRGFLKRYGQQAWEHLHVTTTSQHYTDIFPHENLVYLTADSRNVLHTFDHSKVYVVGAMVDRSIKSSVSLANAKRLKLATARLPLDEFLSWDCGAKNLTLDQMIRILITIKETGCWKKALEFVPKRKHDGFQNHRKENQAKYTPPVSGGAGTERNQIFVSKQRRKKPEGSGIDRKPPFVSDRTLPGQTRLRVALKSKIEEHSKNTSRINWWEE